MTRSGSRSSHSPSSAGQGTDRPEAPDQRTCAAGETVFESGDAGDCAYFIQQGSVEVVAGPQGGEVRVAALKSGELFGEAALIDDGPRAVTVRALEETILVPFSRGRVNALMEQSDPVLGHLLFALLERARNHPYPAAAPAVTDAASTGEATGRVSLVNGMTQALELDEFVLHYQPICELETLQPIGFEALIRWQHPVKGLIPPEDFLWLVEQAGMERKLAIWSLEQACRDWPALRRFIPGRPFISFNLSPAQFDDEEMIAAVKDILARGLIGADELRFALTESMLMEQPELAGRILGKLVELGNGSAPGGDGGNVQDSRNGIMKIDKSFVTPLLDSSLNQGIVQSAIDLAHSLNLLVVAEGIENEDILRQLMIMGCDCGQGWLFGRPQPIEDYLAVEILDQS